MALFNAWHEQYKAARTAEDQIRQLAEPQLSINIDEIATGHNEFVLNGIIITASLTNRGAPSIAESWILEITPVDDASNPIKVFPLRINPEATVTFANSPQAPPVSLGADLLYVKTMAKPIEKGMKVRGQLYFSLGNFPIERLKRVGTRYVLKCKDVNNKEVSATFVSRNFCRIRNGFPGCNHERIS